MIHTCCGCRVSSNAIQVAQAKPASNEASANTFNHDGIIGKTFSFPARTRRSSHRQGLKRGLLHVAGGTLARRKPSPSAMVGCAKWRRGKPNRACLPASHLHGRPDLACLRANPAALPAVKPVLRKA